jgi:hypothetical protein
MSSQVIETQEVMQIPEERRCVFVFADGRRCRMRRWGAELCFHHDPAAAEKRRNRGRPLSRLQLLTATEVHALLTETMRRLHAGQIPAGEAYATGYLAQLLLGNLKQVREEFAEAKTEWDHHVEVITRVRALDAAWGEEEGEDAEEAKEAEEVEQGEEAGEP